MLNAEQISCQESLESMDSRRYGLKGDNGFLSLLFVQDVSFFYYTPHLKMEIEKKFT